MAANYGAHEVLELHEVLTTVINGINQIQLLRGHVQDQQLAQMIDHQSQFAVSEYNNLVNLVNQQGMGQATPYRAMKTAQPSYGLQEPAHLSPNTSASQLDDRDISSIILGIHKASAGMKMIAALEVANPQIRRALQQSATNCSEQAYEVWTYMNQKGYYQVPTMKEMTTNTMMSIYEQAGGMGQSMQNQNMQNQNMQNQAFSQHMNQHMQTPIQSNQIAQHMNYPNTLPQ